MSINYESAWKHLKLFVSDMEFHSRPYKGNGFKAVLLKMEELEKALTTDESKDDATLPDIKIGNYTFERSKLPKFTKEDFEAAKEAYELSKPMHDLYDYLDEQMETASNEVSLEVDRLMFDTFKSIMGVKTPFDVFVIATSPGYLYHLQDVVRTVNKKLKSMGACDPSTIICPDGKIIYNPLHDYQLGIPTKPLDGGEELLTKIQKRWEEVYNET